MKKIYKLKNQIKHYDWGSKDIIPEFLGFENKEGLSFAEVWMGTNNSAPSLAHEDDNLIELKEIAGELKYLLKLIAVDKPLSIQAHPNKRQAYYGFKKETEAGIDINDPKRCYKDKNCKNELLCALTPFTLMIGFRKPEEIVTSVNDASPEQLKLIKSLETFYPQDPAIYSPLYLNLVSLNPGQAIYIPAGVLHSYVSGFGIELMNNSDNVMRGGLTSKYIDTAGIKEIVDTEPYYPDIISIDLKNSSMVCKDFSLTYIQGNGSEIKLDGCGPAICIVTKGEIKTCGLVLKKGESFFIPQDTKEIAIEGHYSLYIATDKIR